MSTAPAIKRNLNWLWFFIVLVVMSVSATTILIAYNLYQQLKPEQLATARRQWQENGPASYRLIYNVKTNDSARDAHVDHYDVMVSGGVVIAARKNGKIEAAERLQLYGMDKLLAEIAGNMERDQEPGRPRTFTRAIFDRKSGALYWYVRRVMGSYERMEISVEKIE